MVFYYSAEKSCSPIIRNAYLEQKKLILLIKISDGNKIKHITPVLMAILYPATNNIYTTSLVYSTIRLPVLEFYLNYLQFGQRTEYIF